MSSVSMPTPQRCITDITGNRFIHGVALDADPPLAYCSTFYPSAICSCGALWLTWAFLPSPASRLTGALPGPASRLTAFSAAETFTHWDDPAQGTAPLCTTARGQEVCTCGRYAICWESVFVAPPCV